MLRFALLALALATTACGGSGGKPVRIVLITIDTLRADGLTAELMPNTLEFAEEGHFFSQFYASTSTTQPTHASLLTGLHPWQHGVTRNGIVLGEDALTLAEALQQAGYATSAVVSSFPLHGMFGFGQGFDEYADEFDEPYILEWEGQALEEGRFYSLADAVTQAALDALERASSERQFFWFHYFDPHDPYGDSPSAREQGLVSITALLSGAKEQAPWFPDALLAARAQYDRDVRDLDRSLGQLFERLERDADEFETHVLFTSDHGESFGELGCLGHGKRLTPEQVHVPLFIVSPAVDGGRRSDAASSIDVPKTVLALAEVDSTAFAGRDLLRRAQGGAAFGMRRTFATSKPEQLTDGSTQSVEGARFYAVHEGTLYTGDGEEIYLADDLQTNPKGEVVDNLRSLFAAFETLLGGVESTELLDPEVQEALRALGYTR
jgi:arylsulfatase A-like enzyme